MDQARMERALAWAARAVGTGAKVVAVQALHDGRTGPWRLRIEHGGGTSEFVLRVPVPGWIGEVLIATGAAALRVAEQHGLAAPRLIASDLDGRATGGVAATLETAVPGSSASPHKVSAERVLEGWQRASGRRATNLAYWDTVAALHTPADLDDWEPGFDEEGNQLSSAAVTARRDAFLRAALGQLERE